jgi:hypothetical protein
MRISLLLLLLARVSPAAADCIADDRFKPYFKDVNAAKAPCGSMTASRCARPFDLINTTSIELTSGLNQVCANVQAYSQRVSALESINSAESYSKQAENLSVAIRSYKSLSDMIDKRYKLVYAALYADHPKTPDQMGPLNVDRTHGSKLDDDRNKLASSISDPNSVGKMTTISTIQLEKPASSDPDDIALYAGRNGAYFLGKIATAQSEINKEIAAYQVKMDNAISLAKSQQSPPDKTPGNNDSKGGGEKEAGSGLDLKSLAALGTAGAGLAQALKKKDAGAAGGSDSGATAPTPNGTASPNAKGGPLVSKLGDDAKSSPVPGVLPTPKKDDPKVAHAGGGDGTWHDPSDVTKGSGFASNSGASSTPAKAAAAGGGAAPTGGGEASASGSKREPSSAPPAAEDTQGIPTGALGGGPPSLGGFGAGASASTSPPGAEPPASGAEDSMKDLLHEMKETAEGGTSPDGAVAAAEDIPMAAEDLFPRVKACYVRLQKAGRVLDSLGEKVSPEGP